MIVRSAQKRILFSILLFLMFLSLFGSFVRGASALTAEEEKKLGKTVLLEIEKTGEIVRDSTLQNFVEKIGYSLVDQVGSTPFEFKFYVVRGLDPNAFAIPGGYVFVTTGLLVLAESQQEIAAVLSHEISHITHRHVAQMIERSKRLNIASIVALLAAMLAGGATGSGAGAQAGAAMAMATAEALMLKYTREMETEADQTSLQYLVKAGYDPSAMITFLSRIHRISLSMMPKVPPYLLTHPAVENRISLVENLLQMGPKPPGPFKTVASFGKIRTKAFAEERESQVAVTHFQSLADANPNHPDGYYGLGLAYRKMGRFDKSIEALQHAHSLAPQDIDISRELAIVHFLSGKVDQAIEGLQEVRRASEEGGGHDLMTLYYLGRGYQEKGHFDKALPLFLKVKKEMPDFGEIYYHLGSVYGRMGQKGLSHFYFGKHFKLKWEKNNALLHFRTSLEWLERGSSEREEAQMEIKELTLPQK